MIKGIVVIDQDVDEIYELFLPDFDDSGTDRASYKVSKKEDELLIEIKARDIKSFKAFNNSIIKTLETYYKISGLAKWKT